jgi:hypothetical protein
VLDVATSPLDREAADWVDALDADGGEHPGIAAHLQDCPPCADEPEGLLAAIAGPAHD